MTLPTGTVLGNKYRVDRLVAEGGMSRIYLGNPIHGAGWVAIKQLSLASDPAEAAEDVKQFRLEYELLQYFFNPARPELAHPAMPRPLGFFEENQQYYLVEEFVPGETLEERIQCLGRLEPAEAVGLALQLLDVMAHLHAHRVVYRDLKPSNILIRRDHTLRLIDFGAARRWRPGADRDTVPLGTPGFASPEHYGRAQTDARSDIYSTGALLHYMLTGRDPAEGSPWTFDPPEAIVPQVPAALSGIVMTALQLDPGRRFQTVWAMRRALINLNLLPTGAVPVSSTRVLATWRRTLHFPQLADYYRWLETIGIAGFGAFFFLVSVPAWFASVPLPHPLVGLWLTAYAVGRPYSNWKVYRNLRVDFFQEGMRLQGDLGVREIFWNDVTRVMVTSHGVDVEAPTGNLHIEAVWPGCLDLVRETVSAAGLAEQRGSAWNPYFDTTEKVYERPA